MDKVEEQEMKKKFGGPGDPQFSSKKKDLFYFFKHIHYRVDKLYNIRNQD